MISPILNVSAWNLGWTLRRSSTLRLGLVSVIGLTFASGCGRNAQVVGDDSSGVDTAGSSDGSGDDSGGAFAATGSGSTPESGGATLDEGGTASESGGFSTGGDDTRGSGGVTEGSVSPGGGTAEGGASLGGGPAAGGASTGGWTAEGGGSLGGWTAEGGASLGGGPAAGGVSQGGSESGGAGSGGSEAAGGPTDCASIHGACLTVGECTPGVGHLAKTPPTPCPGGGSFVCCIPQGECGGDVEDFGCCSETATFRPTCIDGHLGCSSSLTRCEE